MNPRFLTEADIQKAHDDLWAIPYRPSQMIMSRRQAWLFPRVVRWQRHVDRLIRLPRWLPAWIKRRLYARAMRRGMAPLGAWSRKWYVPAGLPEPAFIDLDPIGRIAALRKDLGL